MIFFWDLHILENVFPETASLTGAVSCYIFRIKMTGDFRMIQEPFQGPFQLYRQMTVDDTSVVDGVR
jgi:hypothetical protein